MKANELMIGDWVKFTSKYYYGTGQVVGIELREGSAEPTTFTIWKKDKEGNTALFVGVSKNYVEPISLTPEILEKNGFSGEGYNMGIVGFSVEPVPDEKDGYEVWIWKDMCLQIEHGFTHYKKYIKYVHELQHALCLCGIEKEIEL